MTRVISDKRFIKLNLTTFLSSQLPGFNLQGRVWLNSPLASEWSTPVVPVYIKTSAFTEKNQSELCISTNESAPICPCIALPRWLEEGCCSILLSPVQENISVHTQENIWVNKFHLHPLSAGSDTGGPITPSRPTSIHCIEKRPVGLVGWCVFKWPGGGVNVVCFLALWQKVPVAVFSSIHSSIDFSLTSANILGSLTPDKFWNFKVNKVSLSNYH